MTKFFEKPILNSPYEEPRTHWELDADGRPTDTIVDRRRKAELVSPIPEPRRRGGRGRQAEMVLEFLARIEAECGLTAGRDRVFLTGSGAGLLAPLLGGKMVQEVVAVSAAVEKLHPDVNFVSEIGSEDMKTLFFTPSGDGKSKQVYMQSACSGGTGTWETACSAMPSHASAPRRCPTCGPPTKPGWRASARS